MTDLSNNKFVQVCDGVKSILGESFTLINAQMGANAVYTYPIYTDEADISFYHASTVEVLEPIWTYAQGTTGEPQLRDFGLGFYTCADDVSYPLKLASANDSLVLNTYSATLKGLKYVELGLDLEWLLVVAFHRNDFESKQWCHTLRDRCRKWLAGFDIVVGVISNDKTYSALEGFIEGDMTDEAALAMLNIKDD